VRELSALSQKKKDFGFEKQIGGINIFRGLTFFLGVKIILGSKLLGVKISWGSTFLEGQHFLGLQNFGRSTNCCDLTVTYNEIYSWF
jgi:hypothetical protein